MVKTLQRKFIAITMVSVTAVFLIIMGTINIINYNNVINNANTKLDVLVDNGGKWPDRMPVGASGEVTVEENNVNTTQSSYGQPSSQGGQQGGSLPGGAQNPDGQQNPGGQPGGQAQGGGQFQPGGQGQGQFQPGGQPQPSEQQGGQQSSDGTSSGQTSQNGGQNSAGNNSSENQQSGTEGGAAGNEMIKPNGKPDYKPDGMDDGNEYRKKGKNGLINWLGLNDSPINEETPFESRYFSVTLGQDGSYITCNLDNIASVTQEDAISYATTLYGKDKTDGIYNEFVYRKTVVDGNIMYIFLDCQRDLSSFRSFLVISIIVTVAGLVLVFILSYILSKIALKPVFESYDKQKRFITDASHELKTPVAIIKANTEVIEMETGESEWTNSINKQADRLTSLTEKMVLLSRMDEGTLNKEFVNVNASDLFEEICESYEPIARKMNKALNIDIEDGIVIKGDEANLSQMLSLLMDNAFKYSNEGGNVDVTFHRSNRGKVLKVSNSVDKIKEGRHDELFERFYRRDKSRSSKTGGFGIGLSVVQAIAESHKAKISAVSHDGKSLEFKVVF